MAGSGNHVLCKIILFFFFSFSSTTFLDVHLCCLEKNRIVGSNIDFSWYPAAADRIDGCVGGFIRRPSRPSRARLTNHGTRNTTNASPLFRGAAVFQCRRLFDDVKCCIEVKFPGSLPGTSPSAECEGQDDEAFGEEKCDCVCFSGDCREGAIDQE